MKYEVQTRIWFRNASHNDLVTATLAKSVYIDASAAKSLSAIKSAKATII